MSRAGAAGPGRATHITQQPVQPLRLAHFSDIHVTVRGAAWQRADWVNKHMSSWINHRILGRGYRFRSTERVLAALRADLLGGGFDRLVFSGDATAMGFAEEHTRAAELLGVHEGRPGIAVPGNHDYLTRQSEHAAYFEKTFAPWQVGERVDESVYPFAQRLGTGWLVAVNSCCSNRWAWDARGRVGAVQLRRLDQLLGRLEGSPKVLVTHYPVVLASGQPELKLRALRDLEDLLAVCRRHGISLWLHGHRHGSYLRPPAERHPWPILCAGSATQQKLWSYRALTLAGHELHIETRVFDPRQRRFVPGDTQEVTLPAAGRAREAQPA